MRQGLLVAHEERVGLQVRIGPGGRKQVLVEASRTVASALRSGGRTDGIVLDIAGEQGKDAVDVAFGKPHPVPSPVRT